MTSTFSRSSLALCAAIALFGVQKIEAWTYASSTAVGACGPIDSASGTAADSANSYTVTSVVDTAGGHGDYVKMDFVMDQTLARTSTTAHADIISVERFGRINYYSDATKINTTIGTIPTASLSTATEDGLLGVAVEKPFKNRVYLYYAHAITSGAANTAISGSFRVSRFDMDPTTHMMDMASEKVLIDAPSFRNRWHTAGAMKFDSKGNLYIAFGDNETAFTGPANTHSLIGGILRIKPKDDGSGYTIPSGNFAEYYANQFETAGRTVMAARFRDTSMVRPEIFVKGTRNPYAISINSRDQLVYSMCGADNQAAPNPSETHNIAPTPIFAGWPFWIGAGTVTPTQTTMSTQYGKNGTNEPTTSTAYTAAAPTSMTNPVMKWTAVTSVSMGSDTLPPYTQSKFTYVHSTNTCAMGSVVYNYDGRIANPHKLPPQLDNVWFVDDYSSRGIRAAKVDSLGNVIGAFGAGTGNTTRILSAFNGSTSTAATVRTPLDFQQGPDGALYFLNNNCSGGTGSGSTTHYRDRCSGIVRIEFKSAGALACSDPSKLPDGVTTTAIAAQRVYRNSVNWLIVGESKFSVATSGPHKIQIVDAHGRVLNTMQGEGYKTYSMPTTLAHNGVYFLNVKTNEGTAVRAISRL